MNILKSINKAISKDNLETFINVPRPLDICMKCSEHKPPNELSSRFSSHKICVTCASNLDRCSHCQRRSIVLNESGICSFCLTSAVGVRSYSYKPSSIFHRVLRASLPSKHSNRPFLTEYGKKYRHFGVEIETDWSGSYALSSASKIASMARLIGKGITNTENLLYVKEDSTCDYEFVSHPFTWRYFNKYGKHIFYTLFNMLKNQGFVSHNANDSGIHIHVSKASIKRTTLIKVLSLIYNPSNYNFILDVSQRKESSLKEWASPCLYKDFIDSVNNPYTFMTSNINKPRTLEGQLNRSCAVNILPSNTIEFRLFRGTLNMNSFIKNLQFVKSCLEWADNTSLKDANENGVDSYLNYLQKNQKNYYDLCWFLKKRRYRQFRKTNKYFIHHHSTDLINLRYDSDNKQIFRGVI